jgi:3-hexulose-6-phosphate synthase
VEAAKKYGRKVVVDTIGLKTEYKELKVAFEVAFVELHAGLDEQTLAGYSVQTLISEGRLAKFHSLSQVV